MYTIIMYYSGTFLFRTPLGQERAPNREVRCPHFRGQNVHNPMFGTAQAVLIGEVCYYLSVS